MLSPYIKEEFSNNSSVGVSFLHTNLARLVEDNLDYWENELFPILGQENRPKDRMVVNEIFIPCGYHFTEKQVADAVSYVRAKRFRKEMKSKK